MENSRLTPKLHDKNQSGIISTVRLRKRVKSYIEIHQYKSALFWADKLLSLTSGADDDIYLCAQCLFLNNFYHRAIHLLTSTHLDQRFLAAKYLVARCYFSFKDYQKALSTLEDINILHVEKLENIPVDGMNSAVCLLRGQIYEAVDNRELAAECYTEALRLDVFSYEAFNRLTDHQMLTASQELQLLDSLPLDKQCSNDEAEVVDFLYRNKLKKYAKPSQIDLPSATPQLVDNLDVVFHSAERHYYNCCYEDCFTITSQILEKDPFNNQCLPLHVSVLVELRKVNSLFSLAHQLVDLHPEQAVAWYAVGCYYLLVGKNDSARRFFSKATSIDVSYGPAWLAFGHSFAVENEHDQAMAAYFTASKLMQGCHLPLLYIGLQYGLTGNTKFAEKFFTQALSIAPEDPFALHEVGVIAFQNGDFKGAEQYLRQALDQVRLLNSNMMSSSMAETWEPLLNNLGHVCRKLHKYDEALSFHQQALVLQSRNPSTVSSIAFIHALTDDTSSAIQLFHKALGLRREDTFSTTMLQKVIDEILPGQPACHEELDEPPHFLSNELQSSILSSTRFEDSHGSALAGTSLLESSVGSQNEDNMTIDTDNDD